MRLWLLLWMRDARLAKAPIPPRLLALHSARLLCRQRERYPQHPTRRGSRHWSCHWCRHGCCSWCCSWCRRQHRCCWCRHWARHHVWGDVEACAGRESASRDRGQLQSPIVASPQRRQHREMILCIPQPHQPASHAARWAVGGRLHVLRQREHLHFGLHGEPLCAVRPEANGPPTRSFAAGGERVVGRAQQRVGALHHARRAFPRTRRHHTHLSLAGRGQLNAATAGH
mmetsp:Transcript_11684/g.25508  ORF Transcript_11684/g.25508 Transcript_11684/m.25508 type:complete len:228 (-) Transcript_11684:1278-1961(-)